MLSAMLYSTIYGWMKKITITFIFLRQDSVFLYDVRYGLSLMQYIDPSAVLHIRIHGKDFGFHFFQRLTYPPTPKVPNYRDLHVLFFNSIFVKLHKT